MSLRGKVEQLYRTEARAREPGRVNEVVNEAVNDNTAMVMTDCAKATACISAATTVAELEARCLVPIDDEGTEGDRLAR